MSDFRRLFARGPAESVPSLYRRLAEGTDLERYLCRREEEAREMIARLEGGGGLTRRAAEERVMKEMLDEAESLEDLEFPEG